MFLHRNVLAHRGCWKKANEKNSMDAFERAFKLGFGIETDLRDVEKKIVVSHDMPNKECLAFEDLIRLYTDLNCKSFLALNIKSDGLTAEVSKVLHKYEVTNYFCFDMSIPDTLAYRNNKINFFCRYSELEPYIPFQEERLGVWFDAFGANDVDFVKANAHANNEYACLVSPELHGRSHLEAWHKWKESLDFNKHDKLSNNIMVCTDLPEDFIQYMGETRD